MGKINQLDKSVYNRLSAGEVVENPASIVKELVENSIDAGATHIVVSIEEGGRSMINVTDDGCGIEDDDLLLTIMPHATSKISTAEDLETIATLGFRGEALASIASVSKLEIRSHYIDDDVAHFIRVEDGEIKEKGICSLTDGTSVIVESLFYNTPARSKFLKPPKGEEANVTHLMHDLMLANPDVSFKYISDGKTVCYTNGNGIEGAICAAFGQDICDTLIYFETSEKNYKITGYVGRPATVSIQGNRNKQVFMVNGRVFIDANLPSVIQNAYGERLMKRTFPVAVIDIVMPFDEVDVNVHPSKKEVRFADKKVLNGMIYNAIKKALEKDDEERESELRLGSALSDESQENIIYTIQRAMAAAKTREYDVDTLVEDTSKERVKEMMKEYRLSDEMIRHYAPKEPVLRDQYVSLLTGLRPKYLIQDIKSVGTEEYHMPPYKDGSDWIKEFAPEEQGQFAKAPFSGAEKGGKYKPAYKDEKEGNIYDDKVQDEGYFGTLVPKDEEKEIRPKYQIVGQIFDTYIILQSGTKMILLDQHATHERVLYDKFTRLFQENSQVERMIVPFEIKLEHDELELFKNNTDKLLSIGMVIEIRNDYLLIKEIPSILKDINLDSFVYSFIDCGGEISVIQDLTVVRNKLAKMACRSAIKGGDKLSKEEVDYVIDYFWNNGMPLQCPHGRPTIYVIDKYTIEKWFKRVV